MGFIKWLWETLNIKIQAILQLFSMTFHICIFFLSVGLAVALQLLHGDIDQLRREYMVLFTRGVSITRKLGFSDVIMPGITP